MKQYETYKVYGNAKKIGNDYYEVPYTEYYADGTIKCEGTEDFSHERLHKGTKKFDVYCYNGETLHGAYREGYKKNRLCRHIKGVKKRLQNSGCKNDLR